MDDQMFEVKKHDTKFEEVQKKMDGLQKDVASAAASGGGGGGSGKMSNAQASFNDMIADKIDGIE